MPRVLNRFGGRPRVVILNSYSCTTKLLLFTYENTRGQLSINYRETTPAAASGGDRGADKVDARRASWLHNTWGGHMPKGEQLQANPFVKHVVAATAPEDVDPHLLYSALSCSKWRRALR